MADLWQKDPSASIFRALGRELSPRLADGMPQSGTHQTFTYSRDLAEERTTLPHACYSVDAAFRRVKSIADVAACTSREQKPTIAAM